jgi:secreted trypsin-like serine protease
MKRTMPCVSMKAPARVLPQIVARVILIAGLVSRPAVALVGPALEAPEFAPYVVMVVDRRDMSYCSASVIDPKILLTAAHCVLDPEATSVHFLDGDGQRDFREAAAIEVHPGYRPDAARRRLLSIDLALVRLAEPLPSSFRPVALAETARVEIGQKLSIVGFGIADETTPKSGGTLREGILAVSWSEPPFLIRLRDPDDRGLGACTGDSGAPIFQIGRPAVVAVATWAKGEDGQRCGAATQAVLVAPQRRWIDAILQSWRRETSER